MIKRAITSPVFKAINSYVRRHSSKSVRDDQLLDKDQKTLRNIHDFLDKLAQTTLALKSLVATLNNVLPIMDFILKQFEQFKEDYKDNKLLALMFNSRQAKIEKYYKMTNKSPAYITAIILDPNAKWKYIKNNQAKDQVPKAKKLIEKLQIEYKPTDSTSSTLSIVMPDPSKNAFATQKKRY